MHTRGGGIFVPFIQSNYIDERTNEG